MKQTKVKSKKKTLPEIPVQEIAKVAAEAALASYGIVGLVSRTSVLDVAREILRMEDFEKGIYIRVGAKGYEVDAYVCCADGVKIPEVLSETQKRIAYEEGKAFGAVFSAFNVYCADVKEKSK